MAYKFDDDMMDSQDIISNWTDLNSIAYNSGSNNTSTTVSPNDEINDLRYGMTTTVILM